MTLVLVDNSVWQRLAHQQTVRAAYHALIDESRPEEILRCDVQVAEIAFSARNAADLDTLQEALSEFRDAPATPGAEMVLDIQRRLWGAGLGRAVGAVDTVIAAYALANDAMVVHYDSDFEHIARVEPAFRHRWIVPRGTL